MTEIHVAAAALIDPQGRVLVAQRHADAHQGGLWEFPGGKVEPGESLVQALSRELQEELGVTPLQSRPLIRIRHQYADRSVLLDVHRVEAWQGEPHGREGQPLQWVDTQALAALAMPAADVPIVRALQLPDRYLITPAQLGSLDGFGRDLQHALDAGARLLQVRVFDLDADKKQQLITQVQTACQAYGAQWLLNGTQTEVEQTGAPGWHLNSRALHAFTERPRGVHLLAASCHNPSDLKRAEEIGADFALLSPVLPTRSHPDAEPLGWQTFQAWVDQAGLPVYALGGMQPGLIDQAWRQGAQGIAGIRGLWPGSVA